MSCFFYKSQSIKPITHSVTSQSNGHQKQRRHEAGNRSCQLPVQLYLTIHPAGVPTSLLHSVELSLFGCRLFSVTVTQGR